MGAPKGNRFWEARSKHGRDKIFETPEAMWEAACEYFAWVEDNPFYEAKLATYHGEPCIEEVPRMRPMTIEGLCGFWKVNTEYLYKFSSNLDRGTDDGEGYYQIVKRIKETIRNQKFSGAASGFFNSNIIARDLGLSDKSNIDHSSSDGSMTPKGRSLSDFYDEAAKNTAKE